MQPRRENKQRFGVLDSPPCLRHALRAPKKNVAKPAMAKTHVVQQGETLSSIAAAHGFHSFLTLLNHPQNASLKSSRNPHVLFPGDRVFIPDLAAKTENASTEQLTRFSVGASQLVLSLRLLSLDGPPLKKTTCDVGLQSGSEPTPALTDGDGFLEPQSLTADIRKGEVVAHVPPKKSPSKNAPPPSANAELKLKFDLRIGSLNPEFKLSGQQARLNNLGYFAGYTVKDLDQLLWAAEEFACDKIGKPVTKRPKITPAPPQGEDDGTADPTAHTGIADGKIVDKLKTEHGI